MEGAATILLEKYMAKFVKCLDLSRAGKHENEVFLNEAHIAHYCVLHAKDGILNVTVTTVDGETFFITEENAKSLNLILD